MPCAHQSCCRAACSSLDVAAKLEAAAKFLDFVYLDGERASARPGPSMPRRKARRLLHALTGRHDYAGIKEDLHAWWPRVCSGGILAGHDYTDSGVARAVGEFFGTRQPGGLVFVTPDHPASFLVFKNPQHRARSRHAAFSHEAHAAARGPAGLGRDAPRSIV